MICIGSSGEADSEGSVHSDLREHGHSAGDPEGPRQWEDIHGRNFRIPVKRHSHEEKERALGVAFLIALLDFLNLFTCYIYYLLSG